MCKKNQLSASRKCAQASADGQQAEMLATINRRKDPQTILKIKETDQRTCVNHVLKEKLSGVVRRDTCWQDTSRGPPLA
ncbi:MAG: hypothetical protein JW395_3643 [Nitrospira sp.]|nr:hypothetical protein [Nitrospira sp.]